MRRAHLLTLSASVVVLAAAPACTGSDGDDVDSTEAAALQITVPPERRSPFCQAMIGLADRLETDPPDDVEALIIETYVDIEPEVPEEILPDFAAVLGDLTGEPRPTPSTDESSSEAPAAEASTDEGATTTSSTATTFVPEPTVTDETGSTVPASGRSGDGQAAIGDTPAERLQAYVDFECRGNQNNPGPPPTEPLSAPTTV